MDPNKTLADLRALSARILSGRFEEAEIVEFALKFDALDGWMSADGFSPWQ